MSMLLMLICHIISLITIGVSFFMKIPQILGLFHLKRPGCLSIKGLLLELTSYTIMTSYNFVNGYSLFTYLEYPIILVQEWILIYLVLLYKGLINKQNFLWCVVYMTILFGLMTRMIPSPFLSILAPLCTPVSASSKVIQLMAIVRSGTSHGISMTTWFISAFTNLGRAFTVYVDSADSIILCNLGISTVLSASIMAATYVYRPKMNVVIKEIKEPSKKREGCMHHSKEVTKQE